MYTGSSFYLCCMRGVVLVNPQAIASEHGSRSPTTTPEISILNKAGLPFSIQERPDCFVHLNGSDIGRIFSSALYHPG